MNVRHLELAVDRWDTWADRDRLEMLTALIEAPNFPALLRTDIIVFPIDHPAFGWGCLVRGCGRILKSRGGRFCGAHMVEWTASKGMTVEEFVNVAEPLSAKMGVDLGPCLICPDLPARTRRPQLCRFHHSAWSTARKAKGVKFEQWIAAQRPYPSCGTCRCQVCPETAISPLGLCENHFSRYVAEGKPGNARLPYKWGERLQSKGKSVPIAFDDEQAFLAWCRNERPIYRVGQLNLVGLSPRVKAELKWGLHAHSQIRNHTEWEIAEIQVVATACRRGGYQSLADFQAEVSENMGLSSKAVAKCRQICREITDGLRLIYYSKDDTKDAGFIETDHFGRRFPNAASHFDLTCVSQRWLRDLLWDHLAETLSSARCPRSRGTFDGWRKSCAALSAFLEVDAPNGGQHPEQLTAEHVERFVADFRQREREGLPSLAARNRSGEAYVVTTITRRIVFNHMRQIMFKALETGRAAEIDLSPAFITAFPTAGHDPQRSRNPFSDNVAQALADEANLAALARDYDPNDRGVRDIWEILITTGRRSGEVRKLRFDCVGRYGTFPMLWHDQTKVGNYNEGIRIPESLYQLIERRQAVTRERFERKHGRRPTAAERKTMALFPSMMRNRHDDRSISAGFFSQAFRQWVASLDLPSTVPHQARHTLATNLLRAGANLAHIRQYLGHVSDRMVERYAKVSHSDLEDLLQCVWVAGPGASSPGELLSGEKPLTREEAFALALDLTRRSTPSQGGFCTFQPVVNGDACPWGLNCENCENFVLSGADLLYWRRKQEQWRSIAEQAPDDATADYLHQVFEPTARAITGLERALDALGLLQEALALDLRRPQDYFHRIWSTNFRANDLANLDAGAPIDPDVDGQESA